MRTDELIVTLAREAGPVRPLASPLRRLAGWTAATLPLTLLAALAIGLRADVSTALAQPEFIVVVLATLSTAALSAATALVLGVPGAERSMLQRLLPLVIGGFWALSLVVFLAQGGDAAGRLLQWPFHLVCLVQITGLSAVPGWLLFSMLRRAAPLRRAWSGALATLAAVAAGAAATQFICPLDDPAHQLVGHLLPVAILSVLGAVAGHRHLNWLTRGQ